MPYLLDVNFEKAADGSSQAILLTPVGKSATKKQILAGVAVVGGALVGLAGLAYASDRAFNDSHDRAPKVQSAPAPGK